MRIYSFGPNIGYITTVTRARMTTAASNIDLVLRHVCSAKLNSDYFLMLGLKPHCPQCFGLLVSMDRWLLLSVFLLVEVPRYPAAGTRVPL